MWELPNESVAIIGMALRVPGASTPDAFWRNLRAGVDSVTRFPDDALLAEGVAPELLKSAQYVKAAGVVDGIDLFDTSLFNVSPSEAELMDPQHRLFLECAWEALESAGYCCDDCESRVGVFGGVGVNRYLLHHFDREMLNNGSAIKTMTGNDKDYLTTRVSYKLGLTGPSLCVQTACSTSLVAVHLACRSLLDHQTDIALAGAVSLRMPQRAGYLFEEGSILSPDGFCRAFDADAAGTLFSSGLGIVVLKRLEEAVADGDTIHAVIRGGAVNNDGAVKVGFTAPSVEAQAEVIAEALAIAGVDARSISYVEAHGTGTALGDPIELAALTRVFRGWTHERQFCPIGSVKTNIGHLDTAAGVAGLIKTVLALKHKEIPPSLHFRRPNPRIDFAGSPFYVNTALRRWEAGETPRRAGVSSFGLGGTNCHVVLEEAPPVTPKARGGRSFHLIPLSAKTDGALRDTTSALEKYLSEEGRAEELGDVAFTYQVGRKNFSYRRVVVASNTADAASALALGNSQGVSSSVEESRSRLVCFMFPGQGSQFPGMGAELYEAEPVFRKVIDEAARVLSGVLGRDLRELLFKGEARALTHTSVLQPALFAFEYALARMWQAWGITPQSMIGHSLGEYVAACVAGVMTFEEGLTLVARRGELIGRLPAGVMLSVPLREADLRMYLGGALSLAAVNAEERTVVSGAAEEITRLEEALARAGVPTRRLETSHAFHSAMMEPILEEFGEAVSKLTLSAPTVPYVSNVTGMWITEAEATSPAYWMRQLRSPVRFHEGLRTLLAEPEVVMLEVGPGRVLSSLAKQTVKGAEWPRLLTTMPGPHDGAGQVGQEEHLHRTIGQLWLAGASFAWDEFQKGQGRRRLPLPGYAFQRQRYWFAASKQEADAAGAAPSATTQAAGAGLYIPSWQRAPRKPAETPEPTAAQTSSSNRVPVTLIIHDETAVASALGARLRDPGGQTITVCAGPEFQQHDDSGYTIDINRAQDYDHLISSLLARDCAPTRIVHLLNLGSAATPDESLAGSFYSLLWLAQALGKYVDQEPVRLVVVSTHAQPVQTGDPLVPERALIAGPHMVMPQEYPNIDCRWVDTDIAGDDIASTDTLLAQLRYELEADTDEAPVAYRRDQRFVRQFAGLLLPQPAGPTGLRENGVYLITGGYGGVGTSAARHLAHSVRARLILTGRTPLPPRDRWEGLLQQLPDGDETARRIRTVLELESMGAQVLPAVADVTDEAQMRLVLESAERTFGGIHGVIHAAGVAGGRLMQTTDQPAAESVLGPKVKGAAVLAELLRSAQLDFFVLCSSLQSILGGPGQGAYAAANAYLDAFAHRLRVREGQPCVSINWDTWKNVGMAAQANVPATLAAVKQEALEQGLNAETAVPLLAQLAALDFPQVVVCAGDLQTRRRQRQRRLASVAGLDEGAATTAHPRPELFTPYVPPSTPTEQVVAEVWQEVLGLERVGLDDSVFELGGDSVSAIRVSQKLGEKLGVSVPPVRIFSASTVRALAATLTPASPSESAYAQRQSRGARRRARHFSH